MEVSEFLNSAVFSFDRASVLAGDEHKNAFISIFEKYFQLLAQASLAGKEFEIVGRKAIEFPDGAGRRSEYKLPMAAFLDRLAMIGSAAYDSENDEVLVRTWNSRTVSTSVNMDPIVFRLEVS